MTTKMTIRLGAGPGIDNRPVVKPHNVQVKDLAEARSQLRMFILGEDIGGSHFYHYKGTGEVRCGRKLVARISFNGRVWNPDGSEIIIPES